MTDEKDTESCAYETSKKFWLSRRCNTCKGRCIVPTDDGNAITKCVDCKGEGYIQL